MCFFGVSVCVRDNLCVVVCFCVCLSVFVCVTECVLTFCVCVYV